MGRDATTRAPDPAAIQSLTAGRVRVLNDSCPLASSAMPEEEVEEDGCDDNRSVVAGERGNDVGSQSIADEGREERGGGGEYIEDTGSEEERGDEEGVSGGRCWPGMSTTFLLRLREGGEEGGRLNPMCGRQAATS